MLTRVGGSTVPPLVIAPDPHHTHEQELSKDSIKKRHWEEVAAICNVPTTNALAAASAAAAASSSSAANCASKPAATPTAKAPPTSVPSAASSAAQQQLLVRQDSEILTITDSFPGATPLGDVLRWGLLAHKEVRVCVRACVSVCLPLACHHLHVRTAHTDDDDGNTRRNRRWRTCATRRTSSVRSSGSFAISRASGSRPSSRSRSGSSGA